MGNWELGKRQKGLLKILLFILVLSVVGIFIAENFSIKSIKTAGDTAEVLSSADDIQVRAVINDETGILTEKQS